MCPICKNEAETVYHILWDCPSARDVWGASHWFLQKFSHDGPNLLQVAEEILRKYGQDLLSTFIRTARKIWLRRNSAVHGDEFAHPNRIILEVENLTEEFTRLFDTAQTRMANNIPSPEIPWMQPPLVRWKINWDFAIDKAQCRTGMGMVVRDHTGTVIAAKCLTRIGNLDSIAWEALASLYAVRWCQD